MRYNISIFGKLLFSAAAVALWSCRDTKIDDTPVDEFGATENMFTVSANPGHVDLSIYSNQHCALSFVEDTPWAELSTSGINGDGDVYVDYEGNEGFPRMAKILVAGNLTGRTDTIVLRQRGVKTPVVKLASSSMIATGSVATDEVAAMETNLDFANVTSAVKYTGGEGADWVQGVSYADGKLTVKCAANPSASPRTATLTLNYDNGWGETETEQMFITQRSKDDKLGTNVSFEQVRDKAMFGSDVKINDFMIITGYVVSDRNNGNAGRNDRKGTNSVDYTVCKRTVYLESEDGRYGFNVLMKTVDDNILDRYDKVQILIKDAVLTADENPDRYSLSGITASMIVDRRSGTAADIPVKRMNYSQLTDDDIYTYVTLNDCEVAVQKGSLTPVNEGYTLAGNTNYLSEYPKLIITKEGTDFFLMTNTTCIYRRDGKQLPYGSGDLRGVVVHEKYKPFNYGSGSNDETRGYIGRYQIRHQSYDDLAMARDENDSYNVKLCQYKFAYLQSQNPEDKIKYWFPYEKDQSTANGRMWHTNGNGYALAITWNYLGWVGLANGKYPPFVGHVGCDKISGWGMTLRDGAIYQATTSTMNGDGKGCDGSANNAWTNAKWWDPADGKPHAWMVEFSTKDIKTDRITMQLSTHAYACRMDANPIYWRAAWSLSRDFKDESVWHDLGRYEVPDGYIWGNVKEWMVNGYRNVSFNLPLEILGHEKVYIRLYPESRTTNSQTYSGGQADISKASYNALEYFAIRYNK